MKEGLTFYCEDVEEDAVAKDKETAEGYSHSVYENDVYDLVNVPNEVSQRDEGLGDTELDIVSVSITTTQ